MRYLLVSLVILNVFDALLTHFLITLNLATEGNFFLRPLVGEPGFFVVKFFGAVLAAFILWDITYRHPRLGLTVTSCSVVAYSLVVIWNMALFIPR
jgi:hypothetical protein